MLRSSLLTLLVASFTGCGDSGVSTVFLTPVYDACFSVEECVDPSTICEELTVSFAGYDYTNAICTLGCSVEGPLSPDCPRAWVGLLGSCYPSTVAGGIDDALLCFDPCFVDDDCQFGFRCLGANALCGRNTESCPVADDDAICVPGPD